MYGPRFQPGGLFIPILPMEQPEGTSYPSIPGPCWRSSRQPKLFLGKSYFVFRNLFDTCQGEASDPGQPRKFWHPDPGLTQSFWSMGNSDIYHLKIAVLIPRETQRFLTRKSIVWHPKHFLSESPGSIRKKTLVHHTDYLTRFGYQFKHLLWMINS